MKNHYHKQIGFHRDAQGDSKGGLISEKFSLWLQSPEKCARKNP